MGFPLFNANGWAVPHFLFIIGLYWPAPPEKLNFLSSYSLRLCKDMSTHDFQQLLGTMRCFYSAGLNPEAMKNL